jgi:O-antigen/teichoic acid export membrane protein
VTEVDAVVDAVVIDAAERAPAARPSVARNLGHVMSSQVVTWSMATLVAALVPRFVGPEGSGQLRFAFSVWLMVQTFASLGTSTFLVLEVARDRDRGLALVRPILTMRLVAYVVATLGVATFAVAGGVDATGMALLGIVGASMLLQTIADVFGAALTGLEQMSFPALASVVSKFVSTGAVVLVVVLDVGGVVLVAATSLLASATSLVLLWHFQRRFSHSVVDRSPLGWARILRASAPFLLGYSILIVYQQVDTVVIAVLVDEQTLGWYAAADTLASSLMFVPVLLMATLFPMLGRLHTVDRKSMESVVVRAFGGLTISGVPIGLGAMVVATPISLLLFGDEFRETGPVLAVFALALPFVYVSIMLGQVAYATGRQSFWNALMTGAIVLTIALDVVLVPLMDRVHGNGAIGGGLSYLVAEAAMVGIGIWRVAPVIASRGSVVRLSKVVASGALMAAVTWPIRGVFILVPIAVGVVVYVACVLVLGAPSDEERAVARRAVDRIRARMRPHGVTAVVHCPTGTQSDVRMEAEVER